LRVHLGVGFEACDEISYVAVCDHISKVFGGFIAARGDCAVNFGFVLSLLTIILAVLSVFIEIPIVSNYAFWFAVGAYVVLAGTKG
jgi:hypothetical protein